MSILKAIPGSSNVTLPYPKDSSTPVVYKTTQGVCHLHHNVDETSTNCAFQSKNMLQYITDYHHYCPNTKVCFAIQSSS